MKTLARIFFAYEKEFLIAFLALFAIIVFIPVFTYFYFANDLTSKESIMNRNNTGVTLLDRSNKPFFTLYQARRRILVPLNEIPKNMQQAIIASEDKDFYNHPGFSIKAIIRSLLLDVINRNVAYGGSTLTQQLVKNAMLNSNKSFLRKYQEIVLAQEIERRYSKNEILEMYLNSVYFGEGAFGVEDAALTYFGKHASQLTLPEAALLTAILPSPSRMSPLNGNKKEALARQKNVLKKMQEQGYITPGQKEAADNAKIVFNTDKQNINDTAPHFAMMIKQELIKKFGEERVSRSGFTVQTTLDLSLQKHAEQVVKNQVEQLAGDNVSNGAAVVIDPKSGEVLALVGSENWYDEKIGKVNMATTPRSVGSSFKPIVYSTAFEDNLITPATVLHDVPTTFAENYKPLDYDRKFRGNVLARRALANSLNIPAVEVMSKVGVPKALDMAKRLGITTLGSPSDYGLSLVLGTGEVPLIELTNVYATFANGGVHNDITTILSIKDKQGKTIYRYEPNPQPRLDPAVAFLISSILADNNARAEEFGSTLTISRPAAVKTGTAEDYRDALTLGYTPSIAVGVWVGNNDNSPMDSIAGSLGAAPIWKDLMETQLAGLPVESFPVPSGIVKHAICRDSGLLVRNRLTSFSSNTLTEYFIAGTEPKQYCDSSRRMPFRVSDDDEEENFRFPSGSDSGSMEDSEKLERQLQKEIKKKMREEMQKVFDQQENYPLD